MAKKLGVLIGNGTSRRGFNLESLRETPAVIVGCNEIWNDFLPDVVVAIDNGPADDIRAMPNRPFKLLTRHLATNMMTIDDKPIGWHANEVNSGKAYDSGLCGAAYLAHIERCKNVALIGIDFFRPIPGGEENDIYSGKINRTGRYAIWNRLVNVYSNTTFTRIGPIPEYDWDLYANNLDRKLKLKDTFDASDFI